MTSSGARHQRARKRQHGIGIRPKQRHRPPSEAIQHNNQNPPLWLDGDLNSDEERWDDITAPPSPPAAAEAEGRLSNSFACEEFVSRAAAPPPPLALEPGGVGDAEEGGGGGWSSGDARPPPPPPAPAGPALATGLNCSTLFSFTLPKPVGVEESVDERGGVGG